MKQPDEFDRLVATYLKLYDLRSSVSRKSGLVNQVQEFEIGLRVKAGAYSSMVGAIGLKTVVTKAIMHAKAAINTRLGVTEALKMAEETIKKVAPYASQKVRRSVGIEEDVITADLEAILNQTIAEMKQIGDSDDQIAEFKMLWNSMSKDQKMAFAKSKYNQVGYDYGNYAGYEEGNGWRQSYKRDNANASPYLDALKEFLGK